jgi:hypothetical protein
MAKNTIEYQLGYVSQNPHKDEIQNLHSPTKGIGRRRLFFCLPRNNK